ncbi:MBL fold metallo-hydrolase [Ochrobactrum sp. 3-3]|uniref:MBL fold metallo-hydrolase n=1 Tax=Ochrobactrum sp. 3-3 TaxID=1830124 RepID=UPI002570DF72|nr:MBL fold metallo-hydrolase [Ochrobactrum sp. 3-3]
MLAINVSLRLPRPVSEIARTAAVVLPERLLKMFRHLISSSSLRALAIGAALFGGALTPLAVPSLASAAAPMQRTQAPGYYRIMVGSIEVTALSDGTLDLPADKLLSGKPEETRAALAEGRLGSPVETSFNSYLVNTGERLVLIDAGGGALFGSRLGQLVENLKAAGYGPEQIDDILLTHIHPDHVGGLVKNGAVVFPNATVHADRHDAEFWLSEANKDAHGDPEGFFEGALVSLQPYIKSNRFNTFTGDSQLVPGISATTAYGHTPGSVVYAVENGDDRLLIIGDLIHVGAVQFADPDVTISFDSDRAEAAKVRRSLFDEAAKSGVLLGGAHLAFPGFGHVRANKDGFDWIPVNYSTEF